MELRVITQEELKLRVSVVNDISDSEFSQWRHHPVTRIVLRLLADQADLYKLEALAAFMAGNLTALQEHETRGRVMQANEMVQLQRNEILGFYERQISREEGMVP